MKKFVFYTTLLFALCLGACANRNDSNDSDRGSREPVNQYNSPTDTTDSLIPPTPAPVNP